MPKFLVLNGPNLNLLGLREPAVYGRQTYAELEAYVRHEAARLDVEVDLAQSNHEGVLVDLIQGALGQYDGLVLNAAAYTHTSVALLDALKAVQLPCVEVHLSDPARREAFRHHSFVGLYAFKTFAGLGFAGYAQALRALKAYCASGME